MPLEIKLKRILERQLEPGEKILWADQPVPRFFAPFTAAQLICGIFWTACVFLAFSHMHNFKAPASITWVEVIQAVVFVPFVLFGLYFMSAPLREHRRTLRTVYAITDRRVITIHSRRKPLIRTYPFDAVSQIRIDEKRGGLGDVIIVCGVRVVGEIPADEKDGFYHLRRAREVACRLESLVATVRAPQKADSVAGSDAGRLEKIPEPPLLVEDSAAKNPTKTLPAMTLALLSFGGIALLVFGTPAAIAWATNTSAPGYAFFLVLLFLLMQLRAIYFAKYSTGWPTTQGIIEESYMLSDEDGGYSPRVSYSYEVNGRKYWNNEITTKQRSDSLNRRPAEAIVARYPQGHSVTVHYDPRKPGQAVLEPGRGFGNWLVLAILLACCLASGIWTAATWEGFDSQRLARKWREVRHKVFQEHINRTEEGEHTVQVTSGGEAAPARPQTVSGSPSALEPPVPIAPLKDLSHEARSLPRDSGRPTE